MARTVGSSGERTQARIRDEAARLIARHGFDAMSMRELGAACGIGAPALYRYHPTKLALLCDLLSAHFQLWADGWTGIAVQGPALARLDAFVAHDVGFQVEHRVMAQVAAHGWQGLPPDLLTPLMRMQAAQDRALRDILREGTLAGDMQVGDAAFIATAIRQMIAGVNLWHRPEGGRMFADVIQLHQQAARRLAGAAP
jgi:AcrR family transcriptional regulator